MSISDETLSAYVAGTLSPRARARVDAALASDPALAERLRRHVTVKGIVQSAYGGSGEQARRTSGSGEGERRRAAQIVQLAAVREARKPPKPPNTWRPAHWAAVAGGLIAGAIGGAVLLAPRVPPGLIGIGQNGLVAREGLDRALSRQPSVGPIVDHGPVEVYSTFRARDGVYCRVFRNFSARVTDGVACRERGVWLIRMVLAGPTAAADTPAPASVIVGQVAAGMIVGAPLDRPAETRLRSAGWR